MYYWGKYTIIRMCFIGLDTVFWIYSTFLSNSIRLIINLTSPVLIIYNEQIPSEKIERTIYQKLISYTQLYKVALTDDRIWTVLSNRLSTILQVVSIRYTSFEIPKNDV